MEIDTDRSFLSLTSSEDGSMRSERLSISSEVLSLANVCMLNRTAYPIPTEGNLHLNVTGTGVSMVSIYDTMNKRRIPLYLLKCQYSSSVDIDLRLQKNRKQVISTFNNDALKTGVGPNKNTQAELTILEGHLTTSFTLNDKTLLTQTCEMTREESAANRCEVKVTDTTSFHSENGMTRKTSEKLDNNEDEDLETSSDDEYDYEEELTVQVITAENIQVSEDDADDDFNEGKNEIESDTNDDATDVYDNRDSEDNIKDFKDDVSNEDKKTESDTDYDTEDNEDDESEENVKVSEDDADDDFNEGKNEIESDTNDDATDVYDNRNSEDNIKDFKDDVSNEDKKKIESDTDDDTEDDEDDESEDDYASSNDDLNVLESTNESVPYIVDVKFIDTEGELQYQANCRNDGVMAVTPPEQHDVVDIRTHRIDLLKLMESDRLADYFFEAELISEDNMSEINEYFKKYDKRKTNGHFLQILRNRRVPKHKIEAVLLKAEESHLLELMFPKQSHFVSVATQTED